MNVRHMAQDDLGPVSEIEEEYPSPWTPPMITVELSLPLSITLVAVDVDGNVSGWCCARFTHDEAELLKIAVHPGKRRMGIADGLLLHLEKILLRNNVKTLFLEVRSQNAPAVDLYRKHGFVRVGERPGYYADPVDSALILKKKYSTIWT